VDIDQFSFPPDNVSKCSYLLLAFGKAAHVPRKRAPNAGKQPRQERSRETVAVILEAAARVLETHGLEGYNTNAIAERAGVSIGSVYQYFSNKDALTLALIANFERELLEIVRTAIVAADGRDLRKSLKSIIRALLEAHGRRARLNRILETEEERLRQSAPDHSAAVELKALIAALLTKHRTELGTAVDAAVVDDVLVIVRAMVDATFRSEVAHPAAERRILRTVEGYLHWH
jgi:AcrR family transcriptional regulator